MLSGGVERGTNKRPVIWSCDLWANERPGNEFHWEGTDTQSEKPFCRGFISPFRLVYFYRGGTELLKA